MSATTPTKNPLDNPASGSVTPPGTAPTAGQQEKQSSQGGVDPLFLAYMYIFESVQLNNDTAQIQAKGLSGNAVAQENMIAQAANFNFITLSRTELYKQVVSIYERGGPLAEGIPGNQKMLWSKFTKSKHLTRYEKFKQYLADGKLHASCFKVHSVAKTVAQTELDKFNAANQITSAMRGVIQDQVTVLQQNAQVDETGLNSVVDESQQSIQEGSSLMNMLTSLSSQISRI